MGPTHIPSSLFFYALRATCLGFFVWRRPLPEFLINHKLTNSAYDGNFNDKKHNLEFRYTIFSQIPSSWAAGTRKWYWLVAGSEQWYYALILILNGQTPGRNLRQSRLFRFVSAESLSYISIGVRSLLVRCSSHWMNVRREIWRYPLLWMVTRWGIWIWLGEVCGSMYPLSSSFITQLLVVSSNLYQRSYRG